MVNYFGVRHFSPACAFYVSEFLDRVKPDIVLIEGPSDLSDMTAGLCGKCVKLPAAILAYTDSAPVTSVMYPFAEFSPEYRAMLWAKENKVPARFCDIPSGAALAHIISERAEAEKRLEADDENADAPDADDPQERGSVYKKMEELTGLPNDIFWEYTFEQCESYDEFIAAAAEYGKSLREFSPDDDYNSLREAFMRAVIADAENEYENVAVITGAFHTSGIQGGVQPRDEEILKSIATVPCKATLMPYSYYKLSSRSGYGAGSKAPGYYELLWERRRAGGGDTAAAYLSSLAARQRENGFFASSAEVIEALRLARTLASLRGGRQPSLDDLRDAAVTCMGHGSFGEISVSCADIEIGTRIGELPEGMVNTSVQADFTRQLNELNLMRFRTSASQTLELDLRENLNVKNQEAAFLGLRRSCFLHRLRVLGVSFAVMEKTADNEIRKERWSLRWTPEAEIELVEASLMGDDIERAAGAVLAERLADAKSVSDTSAILSEAFLCGIKDAAANAMSAVQRMAADCVSVTDAGGTLGVLSGIIRFGSIRRIDPTPLHPLMSGLFLRFCLSTEGAAICDDAAAAELVTAISQVNNAVLSHDFLSEERFIRLLTSLAQSDMANPLVSGFSCAVLTERGKLGRDELSRLISRRLSRGTPPKDGAAWFEGFSKKNHRTLIARLSVWEQLCELLDALSDEEFKPVLVCLRRAFADFTPMERSDIAENIGEILQLRSGGSSDDAAEIAEALGRALTAEEQDAVSGLDDFDFGDI